MIGDRSPPAIRCVASASRFRCRDADAGEPQRQNEYVGDTPQRQSRDFAATAATRRAWTTARGTPTLQNPWRARDLGFTVETIDAVDVRPDPT